MSKLLINEHPLQVLPSLAVKIGLNEAIILQQMHYWNNINKQSNNNFRDGYYWTYNSYEEWAKVFPFWSSRTIQRIIKRLEDLKLVVSGNYNKLQIDRTKWYRIDYLVFDELEKVTLGQNVVIKTTDWLSHLDRVGLPLPETTTKITSETTIYNKGVNAELFPHVNIYFSKYLEFLGLPHPYIKIEQMERAEYIISDFLNLNDGDEDTLYKLIDNYFTADFSKANDYNINHFASYNVLKHRMYETGEYDYSTLRDIE